MKSKSIFNIVFLTMILIIISSSVNAIQCYQQLPNESINICSDSSGTITYGAGYVEFNYTKPLFASNQTTLWEVSHGFNFTTNQSLIYNITIPSKCFRESSTNVLLRMNSYHTFFGSKDSESSISCYNGTTYEQFGLVSHNTGSSVIYSNIGAPLHVFDKNYSTYVMFQTDNNYWDNIGGTLNANNPINSALLFEQSMYWDSCNENWLQNDTLCNTWNYTINYYDSNDCGTVIDLPIGNGTLVDCHCYPSWNQNVMPCVNGVKQVLYVDNNICNSTENLPVNNGTNEYCSITVNNNLSQEYIILIVLGIFLVISLIGGILLHEVFFGLCALITVAIGYTFLQYHEPMILIIIVTLMTLMFVVMEIIITTTKRK